MTSKRWGWFAVAAILVGVVLLWPPAPHLDPRLFGDWQRGPFVQRFHSDGTFETLGSPFPMTGVWSVEGRELVLSKPRTIASEVRTWFSKLWRQSSMTFTPPRYQLLEVTADTLRIKPIARRDIPEEVYVRLEGPAS